MLLGNVTKRVVATARLESLPPGSYLCVELDPGFEQVGARELIALDTVNAGPGDKVLILMEGTGARQVASKTPESAFPLHAVVVGVVDTIQL